MKTKAIAHKTPQESRLVKKIILLLLLINTVKSNTLHAQSIVTGVITGTGMSVCSAFSFSTTSGTTTRPANYGNQNFACTGINKDDIAFTNGPGGYRVQKSLWSFIPNTTMTLGVLAGDDAFGGSNAPITLNPNDVVLPCCYGTATNSVQFMQFDINGTVQTPTYAITTWTITAD